MPLDDVDLIFFRSCHFLLMEEEPIIEQPQAPFRLLVHVHENEKDAHVVPTSDGFPNQTAYCRIAWMGKVRDKYASTTLNLINVDLEWSITPSALQLMSTDAISIMLLGRSH
jgi:hypothetical protein